MASDGSSPGPAFQFLEPGNPDDDRPRCLTCGKMFKRVYALERHMIIHDPQREQFEHKCSYEGCGFSSLQKSNVKTHIAAVHEKIKHYCTLPRVDDNIFSSDNRCGRVFSDVPALIRHEKRAHKFYRRGAAGRAKAKEDIRGDALSQVGDIGQSAYQLFPPDQLQELPSENMSGVAVTDKKVNSWLQTNDMDVDLTSDTDAPCRMASAVDPHIHNPVYSYASSSASTTASTSASDVEIATNTSVSSCLSTPPSPASEVLPPVSTLFPTYPTGYYYPYDSASLTFNNSSSEQRFSSGECTEVQASASAVFYDTARENPPIEDFLPSFIEMKRQMEASGTYGEVPEWDGIVTGLAMLD